MPRGHTLFRTILTGIDGTDEDIATRADLALPPGSRELVLGHEALAEVVQPAKGSQFRAGARVVPLVREGCGSCAECQDVAPDMCPSSDYREHGIKDLHGFMQDYWADREDHVVKVPNSLGAWAVLVEPLSIIVKAWDQAVAAQTRLPSDGVGGFRPRNALIVGSGSLASMAALLCHQRSVETTVLDRHGAHAASTRLWRLLGVHHVRSTKASTRNLRSQSAGFDLVIETTGVPKVIVEAVQGLAGNGVIVLLGIPSGRPRRTWLPSKTLTRLVTRNQALIGSVNSNRLHFEKAIRILSLVSRKNPSWYESIVTHDFEPEQAELAFSTSGQHVVKKVIRWQ